MKRITRVMAMAVFVAAAGVCSLAAGEAANEPKPAAGQADMMGVLRQSSQTFREVARQAKPMVVHVRCEPKDTPPLVDGAPKVKPVNIGSGFIISPDGFILTSYHVVKPISVDGMNIVVRLADRREFSAGLVGVDPDTDLAMLHIEAAGLPTAKLADSDQAEVGDWVLAIGSPLGLEQTVTAGIISATGRDFAADDSDYADDESVPFESFIQTDAAINAGNSGGPLLNLNGEVVGVTHATLGQRTGRVMASGLGFATPINLAKNVLETMKQGLGAPRGRLGVGLSDIDQYKAAALNLDGIYGAMVENVKRGSAAAEAGLRTGDAILAVDGRRVSSKSQLINLIACSPVNKDIKLDILREGKRQELPVRLALKWVYHRDESLGIVVVDLVKMAADRYGIDNPSGVLIVAINLKGPAAQAGLRPEMVISFVNGIPTPDMRSFQKVMEKLKESGAGILEVAVNSHGKMMAVKFRYVPAE